MLGVGPWGALILISDTTATGWKLPDKRGTGSRDAQGTSQSTYRMSETEDEMKGLENEGAEEEGDVTRKAASQTMYSEGVTRNAAK